MDILDTCRPAGAKEGYITVFWTPVAPLGKPKRVCSQCPYRHSAPLGLLLFAPEILFL